MILIRATILFFAVVSTLTTLQGKKQLAPNEKNSTNNFPDAMRLIDIGNILIGLLWLAFWVLGQVEF